MLINYGINQKQGKHLVHQNHKIELSNVTDETWEANFSLIRNEIQKLHPGWAITGWATNTPFKCEED